MPTSQLFSLHVCSNYSFIQECVDIRLTKNTSSLRQDVANSDVELCDDIDRDPASRAGGNAHMKATPYVDHNAVLFCIVLPMLCSAFKLSSVASDFCLQPNALSTEICNLLFECVNVEILIYFNFSRRPKTRLLNSFIFKSVSSII